MPQEKKNKLVFDRNDIVHQAEADLKAFRAAYVDEWTRIEGCERIYRGDHWDDIDKHDDDEPRPVTPIIWAAVESISAELVNRRPDSMVMPEREEDQEISDIIQAIIKQNHDADSFDTDYSKIIHDVLLLGYSIIETGYDVTLNNGLGGAFRRWVDARSIMFDLSAGEDIQAGRAVIKLLPKPVTYWKKKYPEHAEKFASNEIPPIIDTVLKPEAKDIMLGMEYWFKTTDDTGRDHVHMAIIANGINLQDSRDTKPDGYFPSGLYPFETVVNYYRRGTPLGWGLCDELGQIQIYSDKMDQIVMENALISSRIKILLAEAAGVDPDELTDWRREVIQCESINGIMNFQTKALPQYIMQYIQSMRETVKEYSGANDFSRGNTGGGVTAFAAISALQEAAMKRTIQIETNLIAVLKRVTRAEIENEREFNILPRDVMYQRDGMPQNKTYKSDMMYRQGAGGAIPIEFNISIKIQSKSRWTIDADNDRIMAIYQAGLLPPDIALECLEFPGKDKVMSKLREKQAAAPQQDATAQAAAELEQLKGAVNQMPTPEMVTA